MDFVAFPKIPRISREVIITEKIDGTNACIHIWKDLGDTDFNDMTIQEKFYIRAGSRSRWITPEDDNHGFAKWVEAHAEELITGLGEGTHYGEWWGAGIQRGYGLKEKRFSLFNARRWFDKRPACCEVVPIIAQGMFSSEIIERVLHVLKTHGSVVAPGFMKPEGIVIFHTGAHTMFKKTIEKDEQPKGV